MAQHNLTGIIGEKVAIDYLVSKNYKILETNWRSGHKEIDIIALHEDELIIIEVKTRRSLRNEMPYNAVTEKKQFHLIEAAEAYIIKQNLDIDVRFDIISIYLKQNKPEIEHIESAFTPQF